VLPDTLTCTGLTQGTHYSPEYTVDVELDEEGDLVGTYYAVVFATESEADGNYNRNMQPKYAIQHGITQLSPIHVDLDIDEVDDLDEVTIGGFVHLNNDDDNENQTEDREESAQVVGEDDLVAISLAERHADLTNAIVTLDAPAGSNKIKVWTTVDKGTEVTLPEEWDLDTQTVPATLYVEGIDTSGSVRDVSLTLNITGTLGQEQIDETDEVKVTVVELELLDIGFFADHGKLRNNNDDEEDIWSGSEELEFYPYPEWQSDPPRNFPVSYTKDTQIGLDAWVKVLPAGLTFDLTGDGPDNYVDFARTGEQSTGANHCVPYLVAADELPDTVCTLSKSISWTINLTDPEPDFAKNIGSSGPHKVYVTYSTPSGSIVTQTRLRWACNAADQETAPHDIGDAIFTALGGNRP